ncbi:MAG: hypothetical protein AAB225_00685 [Acidobacteriota bacterium]
MSLLRKGLAVAVFQCLLVLSLTAKLMYDRQTRPRVWVKTRPWDPSLPIRGRYLALQLTPDACAPYFQETNAKRVLFFVPEHLTELEKMRAPEIWAEVTIPRKGPPRPIRLGI